MRSTIVIYMTSHNIFYIASYDRSLLMMINSRLFLIGPQLRGNTSIVSRQCVDKKKSIKLSLK